MKILSPDISIRQQQIINGTILGGSSIVKPKKGRSCYLSMRDRDANWLEYKGDAIKVLASHAPFTLPKTGGTYRWHSMCYPIFQEYRDLFYNKKGDRKLNPEAVDLLQDWGLAVWFVDCGKYLKKKIVLNTTCWGKAGSRIIIRYFNAIGYSATISEERGGCRVSLDPDSSLEFLNIVSGPLAPFVEAACSRR